MVKKSALILIGIAILAGLLATVYFRLGRGEHYNLLLITLDTTRADHLGCHGYAEATTPALDTLADSGVKFNSAFCNVPLTLPSHATIMTGLYPPEHGCRVNGTHGLGEELTTLADVFDSHGYQTAAFVAAFVLDSRFGLDRGFDTYDDYEIPVSDGIYDDNIMYRYRRADRVADAALSWLKKHSHKSFFCWVHFFDPHRPYYPNQPFSRLHQGRPYDSEIAFMDSQIKRLTDYLKRENLIEKTVIIAVGDHGEGLGEHGEDEHGLLLYNSALRVPLIVSCPGRFPRGREVGESVSTTDLFPTILDIFGWELPGHVSGQSFADVLSGGIIPARSFYIETEFPLTEYGWSPTRGVITPEWKYILAPREELYDLSADWGELVNLADKHPEKVRQIKDRLAAIEGEMIKKESSEVKLDEFSRKTLESLGYLGGGGSGEKHPASLRDPKDAIWMRTEFIQAMEDFKQGQAAEAESTLRKLIGESPESYIFRLKLAKMFYDQGRFQEAMVEFQKMVKMSPEEYKNHYNLGKTLMKLGLTIEATEEFRRALECDPEQTEGCNNLGITLLKSGKIAEAMDVFRKSISLDFNQVDPHNNLGHALLSLGRTNEAMEEFRCSIEINPDFFEGRYNLGLVLLNLGRSDEADRHFREALRIRPDFGPDYWKLRESKNRKTRE